MFSIVLNIIGTLFHFYVAQRVSRTGLIHARLRPQAWWLGVVLLWLVYLAGVHIGNASSGWRWVLGQFSLNWLGILFVMSLCLLAADIEIGRAHV